jgi:hypothetical protein
MTYFVFDFSLRLNYSLYNAYSLPTQKISKQLGGRGEATPA